jgi:hypothetical protein
MMETITKTNKSAGTAADLRLLVLAAGTRVGQNILATLAGRRHGLTLIATSSVVNEPSLFDFDVVYQVSPSAEADAFERALLDIMDRERVDLVIPCRDDDVVFLASLRERRPELAHRLLCGSVGSKEEHGDRVGKMFEHDGYRLRLAQDTSEGCRIADTDLVGLVNRIAEGQAVQHRSTVPSCGSGQASTFGRFRRSIEELLMNGRSCRNGDYGKQAT